MKIWSFGMGNMEPAEVEIQLNRLYYNAVELRTTGKLTVLKACRYSIRKWAFLVELEAQGRSGLVNYLRERQCGFCVLHDGCDSTCRAFSICGSGGALLKDKEPAQVLSELQSLELAIQAEGD